MNNGEHYIDRFRFAATPRHQRAASLGVGEVRRQDDAWRVFENGQRFFSFEEREIVQAPAALLVDCDWHDFKPFAIEVVDHRRGGLERNLVLSGAAAVQNRDA